MPAPERGFVPGLGTKASFQRHGDGSSPAPGAQPDASISSASSSGWVCTRTFFGGM